MIDLSTATATDVLKAAWPWYGGKANIAPEIWPRFGDVRGYVEPFCGTCAVLLNRPLSFEGTETVNDLDGLLSNALRAIRDKPDEVACWVDRPVSEVDCHAEEVWLLERKPDIVARLEGDIEWSDARAAGYWLHGICCYIGSGFCSGNGPWQVVDEGDGKKLVNVRQLPHLGNAGQGVNRQLPHLTDAGRGVNRKLPHLGNAGQDQDETPRGKALRDYMRALSRRFDRVRICCGDWTRVLGGRSGDSLKHFFSGGEPCAVFLDPPYSDDAGRCDSLYSHDDLQVAHRVREWAIEHGTDPRLRIAYCGYDNDDAEFAAAGWDVLAWKAKGGYAGVADNDTAAKANCYRERVWFSPYCIKPAEEKLLF